MIQGPLRSLVHMPHIGRMAILHPNLTCSCGLFVCMLEPIEPLKNHFLPYLRKLNRQANEFENDTYILKTMIQLVNFVLLVLICHKLPCPVHGWRNWVNWGSEAANKLCAHIVQCTTSHMSPYPYMSNEIEDDDDYWLDEDLICTIPDDFRCHDDHSLDEDLICTNCSVISNTYGLNKYGFYYQN